MDTLETVWSLYATRPFYSKLHKLRSTEDKFGEERVLVT